MLNEFGQESTISVNLTDVVGGCYFNPLQPANTINFYAGDKEVMRLDEEGIIFMGERITDAGEAYKAFAKTMNMMQASTIDRNIEP